jgi:hypothetical protein
MTHLATYYRRGLRLAGYEPGLQQTHGWGLGPQTADGVEERWKSDEEYLQLLSRLSTSGVYPERESCPINWTEVGDSHIDR